MKLYFALILVVPALVFGQENFSFPHDGIIRQYIYYSPDKLEDNAPLHDLGLVMPSRLVHLEENAGEATKKFGCMMAASMAASMAAARRRQHPT